MRQRINITLLGHKDHGKSTLIGRLLYDTGSVMEDRIEEVRETSKSLGFSFEYAFLLDSFEEERKGGMTIDVIHAQIKGKRYLYDCIDVPGHKELIQNMLTGASHADAGILMVSAKEGIEEQTGHHLRLAQWLGLNQLIVVVNKMDLMYYEESIFEEIKGKIIDLAGSSLNRQMTFIPVSAYQGDNIVKLSSKMKWYKGPSLFERMENLEFQDQLSQQTLRLPIQDIYNRGSGSPIVAGRIESGTIQKGQTVLFAPLGSTAKVKTIMTFNEEKDQAITGQNVGIVFEPNPESIKRGDVICPPDEAVGSRKEVMANAIFLEEVPQKTVVECGTAQTDCEIEYQSPREIGEVSKVLLRFRDPMIVECSRTAIGRMAIKREGKIVGVAVVLN